jgi:DNA-binding CsgD family transcriptional regulator
MAQFVGRERELSAFDAGLAAIAGGRPWLLDIVGEPGIGKTTLLEQLGQRALAGGGVVLTGRAPEFERDVPFGLFVDALGAHVRSISPEDLNRFGPGAVAELAAIFPDLVASDPSTTPQTRAGERFRLHRAVRMLVEWIAARTPLVLVLDDLHWADPASAELIASLVRAPLDGPVLIAIARRATPLIGGLEVALDHAVLGDAAERLTPDPLSLAEADALLPAALPQHRKRALYEQSGGNPFYLDQLGRSVGRTQAGVGADGPAAPVPASVAAALGEELLPLPDTAIALLRAAAVVGDPFEITLTATAGAIDETAALTALDELMAADLVRQHDTPRTFVIRHPLVRSAVYSSTPAGWRLAAHGRAAAVLDAAGASASARAHHVEQCASLGDLDAAALLAEAAAEVSSRAPATAAQWLASAARISGAGPERAALLPQLAGALVSAGRLDEALAVAKESLEGLPPEHPAFVQAVGGTAAIERMLGQLDSARARLTAALAGIPDRNSAPAVALRLELAADASLAADFELMLTSATETLAAALELGDPPVLACSTAALGFALYSNGRFEEATDTCRRAMELVDALTDEQLAMRLETILHLGWAEWFMGRFENARVLFDRGLLVSRSHGNSFLVIELSVGVIVTFAGNGLLAAAVDLGDGALEEARLMGNGHTLVWALFAQVMALEPVADPSVSVRVGEEALVVARNFEGSTIAAACGWVFASALVAAGDGPRAVEVMLELQGGPELPYFFGAHRAACYEVLTRAELLSGRQEQAADWAARARAVSEASGLPFAAAMADRAEAHVAFAAGAPDEAARLAERSVATTAGLGALVESGRGRILVGQALAAAGRRDEAAVALREAEAELLHAGASLLQADAVRELRRIGRRVNRQGRAGRADPRGSASLTPREREIAVLAAAGETNRAIGAQLFLSEKTIETHLANAFVKLGVQRRGALGEALAAADAA